MTAEGVSSAPPYWWASGAAVRHDAARRRPRAVTPCHGASQSVRVPWSARRSVCDPLARCPLPARAGYFLNDFVDMLLNQKVQRCWELLLHHLVVSPSQAAHPKVVKVAHFTSLVSPWVL